MINKQDLARRLLSTNLFINNNYFETYIDFICNYTLSPGYSECHHVLPIAYYKHLYNCDRRRAETIANKDTLNIVIRLNYKDHCYAHWLLYFCTTDFLKDSNATAVIFIQQMYEILSGKYKHKIEFVQEDFELLQQYKDAIINDLSSQYFSEKEIEFIKNNYGKYGSANYCAEILGRPVIAIYGIALRLGLMSAYPDWSEEELAILYKYYPTEGDYVYKRLPHRTKSACRTMAKKYEIKTVGHYWTEEDILILKENFGKIPLTEIAKLLPGRTYAGIKHYAQRHREELLNGK